MAHEKIPVLLVDDRPDNLTSLEVLLEDMNLDLVKAMSGNEALQHMLHADFALVLLDVQMPEMDGFETAELMRQNPKTSQVPIIFITAGMNEASHRFKGYEAGAVDYLMKPLERDILKSKVRVFCDLFSQRLELRKMNLELELQNHKLREAYRFLEEETALRLRTMEELRQKEEMMIQQNRLAAMGEMISNIAHQWRQPLNSLGLIVQRLGLMHDVGEFTPEFLHQSIDDSMKLIQHMSGTIDDFRHYFRPNKEKVEFNVADLVEATIRLVGSAFDSSHIRITVEKQNDVNVQGYPAEYAQVLLNVLINAKEAFEISQPEDPHVRIVIGTSGEKSLVTITDNAGGISDEVISKVFDPLFTTKETHGTGIGLFMSKNIIEKSMNGRISVRNAKNGAEFYIEV